MSGRARLGLIALAVVVAVAAFVVFSPEEETSDKADDPSTTAAQPAATDSTPAATAESTPPPAAPEVVLRGGSPVGGVQRIVVEKGGTVRLIVSSDATDEIHVHGYDVTRTAGPGKPARFRFPANAEGVFEVESHTAEDAGRDPLIARLVVEPS